MSDAEFVAEYQISKLAPADYNPRKISEESFEELKKSLLRFGVVKPLIVNRNNGILVAGHQRTKAMKAVGIQAAPVILISNTTVHDEICFNLFHNSIETNLTKVYVSGEIPDGYSTVKSSQINYDKNLNPTVTSEIGRLFMKYGAWGSVVVDQDGLVLANSDYAVCLKLVKEDLLVYKLQPGEADAFCKMNSIDYGEYCYEALGVKAYNQYHCQMVRLSEGENVTRLNKSTLYETMVLPKLEKHHRVIDFGAGRCAYPKMLNKKGFNVLPYEPHLRMGNNHVIDINGVVKQIKALEADIQRNGLADVVILDSVLNSVTSIEFEDMVLTSCNALLKKDGMFFAHCRDMARVEQLKNAKRSAQHQRSLEFMDKDRFSVSFRSGVFTMQHFHSKEDLFTLLSRYFHHVEVVKNSHVSLSAMCKNPKQLDAENYQKALVTEFNMEYPGDIRHNSHHNLVKEILGHVANRNND